MGLAGVLVAATAAIAWQAELVSGALEATSGSLGLSPVFLGVIVLVLALVGTASDLFAMRARPSSSTPSPPTARPPGSRACC